MSKVDDSNEPQPENDEVEGGETTGDTEGHMFLPHDAGTARSLAQGRSADLERQAKDRQRQKEARPNRR